MSLSAPVIPTVKTAENAKKFIVAVMDGLKQMVDPSTDLKILKDFFEVLSTSYFQIKSFRNELCNTLLENDYIKILTEILIELGKKGYFETDEIWFCVYYAFNGLWNYTDHSQALGDLISCSEMANILIKNSCVEAYRKKLHMKNMYYLLKSNISIIHNIARCPNTANVFKRDDLKNALVALIKINDSDFLGIISMLTLSMLVDESELHLLEEGKSAIKALIDKIRIANSLNPRRIDGFAVWELLNGLKMISVNDNMKKTIVRENGLNLIADLLQDAKCEEADIEGTLGIAWNLCFDKEIRGTFQKVFNLKELIKPFINSKNSVIKKSCDGIMWLIDQKDLNVERVKSGHANRRRMSKTQTIEYKFDVFLSYSRHNQQTVLTIRDVLVKSNISVWIDIDQVKGDLLESMANGIENSRIFLMAVSEAYRTSPNCRTEAEYAFSLKKPVIPVIMDFKYKPMGWLGIMMGSKTYYEFSERRNFDETAADLVHAISTLKSGNKQNVDLLHHQSIVPVQSNLVGANPSNHPNVNTGKLISQPSTIQNLNKWTKNDVANWLVEFNLSQYKSRFVDYDGRMINSLVDIFSKSPEFLFQTARTEFGFKLIDIVRFNLALQHLIQQH